MRYALETRVGLATTMLWHKAHDLEGCDLIVLPGGFSYGDYLRSGAISRFSPIMQEVIAFAKKGGRVLGVCNGFQVLTEAHLVPGALLRNNSRKFLCQNQFITPATTNTAFTSELEMGKAYSIPIAHGEGRYYASEADLAELKANDQILFRYSDAAGNVTEEANPNGSLDNIAGVCNKGRNVFGLMPHPERAADPALGNQDGLSMLAALAQAALA